MKTDFNQETMEKKRNYHRDNCSNRVREIITDLLGRTIVLSGQFAFEWTITIYSKDYTIRTTFKTGAEARKKFRKYKRKY